jgi:HECT-like ubiquitin-transferase
VACGCVASDRILSPFCTRLSGLFFVQLPTSIPIHPLTTPAGSGSSLLPAGGIAELKPKLTVVRKHVDGGDPDRCTHMNLQLFPLRPLNVCTHTTYALLAFPTCTTRHWIRTRYSHPHNVPTPHLSPLSSRFPAPVHPCAFRRICRYMISVMTCFNYIKLPEYSSAEVLAARLKQSMELSRGSFYLS